MKFKFKLQHFAVILAAIAIPLLLWGAGHGMIYEGTDGLHIGYKQTDRISFFNASPTPQPVSNNNAAVNATPLATAAGTPSTANMTAAELQINALTVLTNQLASNLTTQGLMATPSPTVTATATATATASATASPTPTP